MAEQAGSSTRLSTRTLHSLVRAVHADGAIVVPDLAKRSPIPGLHLGSAGISSLAVVPLCRHDGGGCLLVTSGTPRDFSAVEIEGLGLVAAQTSEAIGYLHQATAVRHDLARELHDTVTQTLTLLTFSLDELLDAASDHASHGMAVIARAHASTALHQLRHLMGDGRLAASEGVLSRLRRLLAELTRAGTEVRLSGTLIDDTLPEHVSDCLLHIGHEALMNVRRHAGARLVTAVFKRGHSNAWLVITDDGRGLQGHHRPEREFGGHGLSIMHERARRLGGATTIRTRRDGGTVVTARIPLSR